MTTNRLPQNYERLSMKPGSPVDINDIRGLNNWIGHYFFSPSTIRAWNIRPSLTGYPVQTGWVFVESSKNYDGTSREYRLWVCLYSGEIIRANREIYPNHSQATTALKKYIAEHPYTEGAEDES